MPVQKTLRFLRTIRHLKTKQLFYQLFYRIRKSGLDPVSNVPHRQLSFEVNFPAFRRLSTSNGREFRFIGENGTLSSSEFWNDPSKSKLWLYNLHYLDDLVAIESIENKNLLIDLLKKWIQDNSSGEGNGWEAYPLSLRIVNIVKWLFNTSHEDSLILDSLATQTKALENRIEHHILGNHIFANGKALVFAGVFFGGSEGDRWLKKGLGILAREVPEQFLDDGGHFERSPMYHSTLLWDMCDLINLAKASPVLAEQRALWQNVVVKGIAWLDAMTHPDGEISFFNDSAFGIAPTLEKIRQYASSLEIEVDSRNSTPLLETSGFLSVHQTMGHKLIANVGNITPAYQPGHAHAESLCFELSLFGNRVFVNSGTSEYGASRIRLQQRKTAAHNTVEVDSADSSEVWSGFRVGRRAEVVSRAFTDNLDEIELTVTHNGYSFLPGKPTHTRTLTFGKGTLTIKDQIQGTFKTAIARFHLHPSIRLTDFGKGRNLVAQLPAGKKADIRISGASKLDLENSSWHPKFGHSVPNKLIAAKFAGNLLETRITWEQR